MVTEYADGGAADVATLVDAAWAAARCGNVKARQLADRAWAALSATKPEDEGGREVWEGHALALELLERELARGQATDDAALGRVLAGLDEDGPAAGTDEGVDRVLARLDEEFGPLV